MSIIQYNLGDFSVFITDGSDYELRYKVEMTSGGMIRVYIPCLMMIGSGIRVILRIIPQEFERAQCVTNGRD
jgi:hypothetical protein